LQIGTLDTNNASLMIFDLLLWWALLAVLGLAFLPIANRIFPSSFPDRGRAFAKPLALVALTYASWLLASAGVPYGTSLAIASVALAAASLFAWRGFSREWGLPWLRDEAVFLGVLSLFAGIRALQPDVFGAEKYMDFAFFNTLIRTSHLPPQDPWMSGVPINYYYFGYLSVASLARLTRIDPAVAYNLSLATIGAVIFAGGVSIGACLSQRGWGGVLGGIALVFIGNLDAARQLLVEGKPLAAFDYWRSSRVVPNTINEFPFFSLYHGDLHPHVIALMINVTLIGVALATSLAVSEERPFRSRLPNLGTLTLLLAALALTNPWDIPVYFTLIGCLSLHRLWNQSHPFRAVLIAAAVVVSLAVGMTLLSLPFTLRFEAQYHGIGRVHARTAVVPFLTVFGFLLLPAIARLARESAHDLADNPPVRELVFACVSFGAVALYVATKSAVLIFTAAILIVCLVMLLGPLRQTRMALALALVATAATALGACEVVYLRDPYGGELHRMNTVFKLYFQSWVLLALAFPAFVSDLLERPGRLARAATALVLLLGLVASLCYPMAAISLRWGNRALSLDGLAYLERDHPSDAGAIRWLASTAQGQPVVLEASGDPYSYYARVSSNTGLPTVLGWANHEDVWRGHDPRITERKRDVERIYTETDVDAVRPLLVKYRIAYVFVGDLERQRFAPASLDKFREHPELFEPVYKSGTTEIFAVRNPNPSPAA
jgi:YYY domain-containing protein